MKPNHHNRKEHTMSNQSKILCGKAHSGNKTLVRFNHRFHQCPGCGHFYTYAQVSAAKTGHLAGQGHPYITPDSGN